MKLLYFSRVRVLFRSGVGRGVLLGALAVLAILAAWWSMPNFVGNDYAFVFRPAAAAFLAGEDPYAIDQFLLPPWVLLLLAPLHFLPLGLAMAVIRVAGLGVYAYVAWRLDARPLGVAFILLSPQVMHNVVNGNLDWLAFLGFVLPPPVGLFFLAIKPQLGLALAIYWGVEALRRKRLWITLGPFVLVMALSFLWFGFWPGRFTSVDVHWNTSFWPLSLPFGLVLLYYALRQRRVRIAQAISPLFSPHVMFHSWASFLYALAPDTAGLGVAVLSSWIFIAITALR